MSESESGLFVPKHFDLYFLLGLRCLNLVRILVVWLLPGVCLLLRIDFAESGLRNNSPRIKEKSRGMEVATTVVEGNRRKDHFGRPLRH